jgi:hypothetical protein
MFSQSFPNRVLDAKAAPGYQIVDDEYQDYYKDYVNERSPDVEQETQQPKNEQNHDDRPENT